MVEVVPVDRADVVEAQLLEHGAAGPEPAGVLLGAGGLLVEELRQLLGELLRGLAQAAIGAARDEPREIGRHGADGRRDRHVVVVEDDDEARMHGAGVVHRLVGHAGRHGAVADHGDHVVLPPVEVPRHRHAEAGRDRGGGMGGPEGVVLALRALGEAREPAALAQGPDPVAAPGEDLVRIGLVADVPDQPVARRVEDVVKRDRELDDPKPGAEMPAGDRDGADRLRPQLVRDLPKLVLGQPAQIVGRPMVSRRGVATDKRSRPHRPSGSSPAEGEISFPSSEVKAPDASRACVAGPEPECRRFARRPPRFSRGAGGAHRKRAAQGSMSSGVVAAAGRVRW